MKWCSVTVCYGWLAVLNINERFIYQHYLLQFFSHVVHCKKPFLFVPPGRWAKAALSFVRSDLISWVEGGKSCPVLGLLSEAQAKMYRVCSYPGFKVMQYSRAGFVIQTFGLLNGILKHSWSPLYLISCCLESIWRVQYAGAKVFMWKSSAILMEWQWLNRAGNSVHFHRVNHFCNISRATVLFTFNLLFLRQCTKEWEGRIL